MAPLAEKVPNPCSIIFLGERRCAMCHVANSLFSKNGNEVSSKTQNGRNSHFLNIFEILLKSPSNLAEYPLENARKISFDCWPPCLRKNHY